MENLLPIVSGVLILLAIGALVMSRFTWRWHTILMAFLVLCANLAFMYLAARTLKTHQAWRGELAQYEKALQTAETENLLLLEGEKGPEGVRENLDKPQTLLDWQTEASAALYGRGRSISGVRVQRADPASGEIEGVVEQAEAINIPEGSTVYVFEDRSIREPQTPGRFLGDYVVTKVAEKSINMRPLVPDQKSDARGSLVIYEVSPQDSHEAFARLSEEELNELIRGFSPQVKELYLLDGKPVTDEQAARLPAENIWSKVKFLKTHTVANAGPPVMPLPTLPNVNPNGAVAVDAAAGDVAAGAANSSSTDPVFAVGAEGVFDPKTAAQLIANGIAEPVKNEQGVAVRIFVRSLNEYPTAMRAIRLQIAESRIKIAEIIAQIATIEAAQQLVLKDIETRKAEALRLQADLTRFQTDAKHAETHARAVQKRLVETVAQVTQTQQQIVARTTELQQLQLKAAEDINRRLSLEVSAAGSGE